MLDFAANVGIAKEICELWGDSFLEIIDLSSSPGQVQLPFMTALKNLPPLNTSDLECCRSYMNLIEQITEKKLNKDANVWVDPHCHELFVKAETEFNSKKGEIDMKKLNGEEEYYQAYSTTHYHLQKTCRFRICSG